MSNRTGPVFSGWILHLCALSSVVAVASASGAAAEPEPEPEPEPAPALFKYEPQTLTEANRARVGQLYSQTCAGCHGAAGGGVDNGLALYAAKVPLSSAAVIHFGAAEPVAKPIIMPAYGELEILTPTEIGELAAYITTFKPPYP